MYIPIYLSYHLKYTDSVDYNICAFIKTGNDSDRYIKFISNTPYFINPECGYFSNLPKYKRWVFSGTLKLTL